MPVPTLLYDSDCGFCRWSLGKVLAWDRRHRIRPVALQGTEADALLRGMSAEDRMASWHLATNGEVYSAGAAAAPLLRLLPGGGPLAALASRFPRATERLYRLTADHRSLVGRVVPAGSIRRADRRIEERS